ncbi:kinase-like protein [Hypoxylon sp. EC38]|nr:kinase-like protein [Hypoxylon sp. EC38]
MSIPWKSEDAQSMVEGIEIVQDYGLRCAWRKYMKDLDMEASSKCLSFDIRESSGLPQSDSSSNADDLDDFHSHWSDRASCIKYLQDILEKGLECGYCGSNRRVYFLPLDKLLLLLRKPIVKRAFEEIFRGDEISVDQMVDEMGHEKSEHSRLMILATLIYTGRIESLESFIGNGIHDTDLPLRRFWSPNLGRRVLFHKKGDTESSPTMNYLSDGIDLDHFCFGQYRYLIPFFDMSPGPVRFYKFDDPHILLPFTDWYEPKVGGYGTVRRVKIHPAHHNYELLDGESEFAIKEISANFKWYTDEIRALGRFSGQRSGHKHLIRLLMTMQHGDKYYLVFPLARGNLVDLWEKEDIPLMTPQLVEWVLDQCLGITEGLWKIHHDSSWADDQVRTDEQLPSDDKRNRGRHGDIKPENILCFSIRGGNYRLVITDFGLTRFHSALSVSKIAAERVSGFSRTYRPPELDMKSFISQAYDMWSLGCVFLEFVSWLLIGYSNTRSIFNQARLTEDISNHNVPEDKFFNIHDGVPVVKPSVKNWIHKLRTEDTCPTAIKGFLDIIENGLLQPNHQDRWRIKTFHNRLKAICDDYKKALNKPRDSNASSTLAVFDEKRSIVGHLRGPLGQTQDERPIEFQRKILEEVNLRRNPRRDDLNNTTVTVGASEGTGLEGQNTTESSGQSAEEEIVNQDKTLASSTQASPKPNPTQPDVKPSRLQSIGVAFQGGYARCKAVLRWATCIRAS